LFPRARVQATTELEKRAGKPAGEVEIKVGEEVHR